jgi:hypothetical protein
MLTEGASSYRNSTASGKLREEWNGWDVAIV